MTEAEALAEFAALNSAGASITVVVQRGFSSTVSLGDVISIDPPVTALLEPIATLTMTVSLGAFPASRWSGATPEVTAAAVVAASADVGPPPIVMATMVFLDFPGDPTYVTDAGVNLNWGGHEWIGLGKYGSIEGPTETLDMVAQPFRLTVSGVDPGIVQAAMETSLTTYAGRDVDVYVAILDQHTYAFLDDPSELCKAYISVMTINVDQNSGSIVLDCEHRLRRLPSTRRWTDEDQRSRHPTDRFFQFTPEIRGYVAGGGGRSISYTSPTRNRERDRQRPY